MLVAALAALAGFTAASLDRSFGGGAGGAGLLGGAGGEHHGGCNDGEGKDACHGRD